MGLRLNIFLFIMLIVLGNIVLFFFAFGRNLLLEAGNVLAGALRPYINIGENLAGYLIATLVAIIIIALLMTVGVSRSKT